MQAEVLTVLGGTGMFLLGMLLMTGALTQMASRQTRAVLRRLTTSPAKGAVAGAVATALIQSSSAILIITIGFVGAGLMSFAQAVGVVLGANVGTTITGWMVVLLGFKLDLATFALPGLFLAGLLSAVGLGAWARLGGLLAGFSLIFLGLDMMQTGAEGFRGLMVPGVLPTDSFWGRLQMLGLGVAITVVIQSSSAGVAMTLVFVSSGILTLPQAGAMVIGMDIGTTFKSVVVTLGGSRDMRRTAVAHVAYNVVTGIAAFAVLGWAIPALESLFDGDAPAALAAFHTLFNLLGALLMLPVTQPFARLIERLIPGVAAPLGELPDRRLLSDAGAATDAARGQTDAIAAALFAALGDRLRPGGTDAALLDLGSRLGAVFDDLGDFLAQIRVPEGQADVLGRRTALLHRLDHLNRLWNRAKEETRLAVLMANRDLARSASVLGTALRRAARDTGSPFHDARMRRIRWAIRRQSNQFRSAALLREDAVIDGPESVFDLTDAIRSLDRMAHHAERVIHYGRTAAAEAAPAGAASQMPDDND